MEKLNASATLPIMKATPTKPAHKSNKPESDLERARRKRAALKGNKDWMKTIRLIEDTPDSREAWDLGEAWRRAQTKP